MSKIYRTSATRDDPLVGFRMDSELHRDLKRAAEVNGRDLSKEIRHRLAESLDAEATEQRATA